MLTLTTQIFNLSAPYANEYQGLSPRVLFVCSAGLLRSPTGAALGIKAGMNTRSAGSEHYALVPVSANLIEWAHKIVFVNEENYLSVMETFRDTGYDETVQDKAIIWNVPDNHNYMADQLVEIMNPLIETLSASLPKYSLRGTPYVGKTAWDI